MTNKEAIKYLIAPTATSTNPSESYLKQKEAYEIAIKALEERSQGDQVYLDNAPTVEQGHYLTNCQNCKSDYSRGYNDGYVEGYKDGMTGADMRGEVDEAYDKTEGMY